MWAKLPFMVIFDKNPRNYLQIIISRVQLLEREHLSITQSKILYHEYNKVVAKSDKTHHEVVGWRFTLSHVCDNSMSFINNIARKANFGKQKNVIFVNEAVPVVAGFRQQVRFLS